MDEVSKSVVDDMQRVILSTLSNAVGSIKIPPTVERNDTISQTRSVSLAPSPLFGLAPSRTEQIGSDVAGMDINIMIWDVQNTGTVPDPYTLVCTIIVRTGKIVDVIRADEEVPPTRFQLSLFVEGATTNV